MIVFVNGERREVNAPATLDEVLGRCARGRRRAGSPSPSTASWCPARRHPATNLDEAARVEVVTAVQGG